jgi:hypothetical protein
MSKRKGHPHKWCVPERVEWLPGPGDVRTTRKICIPYNPLILQKKKKPNSSTFTKKSKINIFHKAKEYSKLLEQGVVNSKAQLAKKEGITRARITQILNLLKLAPEIQSYLLSLTDAQAEYFTEKKLRPITQIKDHKTQLKKFHRAKIR